MRLNVDIKAEIERISRFFVQSKRQLWLIDSQRPVQEALFSKFGSDWLEATYDTPQISNAKIPMNGDVNVSKRVVNHRLRVFIGQLGAGVDDAAGETVRHNVTICRHLPDDGECKFVHAGQQGAVHAHLFWQHVEDLVDQINGRRFLAHGLQK